MWGRILQVTIACWIAAAPLFLDYGGAAAVAWGSNVVCAAAIALLAGLSFHPRLPHIHVAAALPAFWLIGVAYFLVPYPAPPLHQSNIIVGLLLLIVILVPTRAAAPPRPWSAFNGRDRPEGGRRDAVPPH